MTSGAAYVERAPAAALLGLVECGWVAVSTVDGQADVLPDGCMDLVWTGGELLVAGPDTAPHPADRRAGVTAAGLRFAPGMLPSLLEVPAAVLTDQRVPLTELHPRLARVATAALATGTAPLPVLTRIATGLPGRPPGATTAAVVGMLAGDGAVADIADALGCTTRTLHRHCSDAFGYGPAVLRRVLRFRRAVALLRAGAPIGEVAFRCGYADQPHLSREVRALAGASPRQLASGANRSTPLPSGSSTTA